MDLVAGAAGGLLNALLHTKGKLIKIGKGGKSGGGGLMDKLGAAAASMSPVPIPGLGAKDPDNEVSFMFNPTSYRLSRTISVNNEPNVTQDGGMPEFLGTGPLSLSMSLFFDDFASAKGDVTPKINKLFKWQIPEKKGEAPPLVKLEWGTNGVLTTFKGALTSVVANYTVFNKGGTPIQAEVEITIEEVIDKPKAKPGTNPTSHAIDARRIHVVVEGETLASVANAEFGDPGYWRAIAEANSIDDPIRVRPGRNLLIPSIADAVGRTY
jgi:hypothetical protein